jgi:hypothetical protein
MAPVVVAVPSIMMPMPAIPSIMMPVPAPAIRDPIWPPSRPIIGDDWRIRGDIVGKSVRPPRPIGIPDRGVGISIIGRIPAVSGVAGVPPPSRSFSWRQGNASAQCCASGESDRVFPYH